MVYRIYVEKKPGLDNEARALLADARDFLGIRSLTGVRILNRYDAEGLTRELFDRAVTTVFAEPQLDVATPEPDLRGDAVFAVEYLPGQFDQRADSAAQCIQFLSRGRRPLVRSARVYVLTGTLEKEEIAAVKKYVINPVESREAGMELPRTLSMENTRPEDVPVMEGFTALAPEELEETGRKLGLAMDPRDLLCCQSYFRSEHRDPTLAEIRILDTYWSDHCRHTTFLTEIGQVTFEDELLASAWRDYLKTRSALGREDRPLCLMDLATVAARALKADGRLRGLDESEEINACTVKIRVTVDGREEPWLLLFKNETHNHPTEIEPFGGAATCIGGAIRDPLSGRAYVYGAMRVTGAADPTVPVGQTLPGKLPQRKLVTTAAAGYSSYGNQIGLATGIVEELYHPGYAAKRMEIGAVIAAAPAENVRREVPRPGDVVILLGGSTGRDGIGGATGSSKAHTARSVETCGAEVQKGNAPEERKLQRLFRNPAATRLIRRCNDFGAGGVSVAIGELADGLNICLDAVPRKYEGLDGTELAISESQERMAVVVAPEDAPRFLELAAQENLQAVQVAEVTRQPRLVMTWRGRTIVDISREFLSSNGASRKTDIAPEAARVPAPQQIPDSFEKGLMELAGDLRVCSRQGLCERFDSTIGAGTVLMPFGGVHQLTPAQAMVQRISLERGTTRDCSLMAWGFRPEISAQSPYHGAYLAVVESVSRLIASGAGDREIYLTFQEYFEKPGTSPRRWGQPLAALLGAFRAQMDLGIAAIGGKDSMSGSFEQLDVPPTLVSFAVSTAKDSDILSPELKGAGHPLVLLMPEVEESGLPSAASLQEIRERVRALAREGKVLAACTPGPGGIAVALAQMALGNALSVRIDPSVPLSTLFGEPVGAMILELRDMEPGMTLLGTTGREETPVLTWREETLALPEWLLRSRQRLEGVYATCPAGSGQTLERMLSAWPGMPEAEAGPCVDAPAASWPSPALRTARPRVLIPAFPGTNCEVDSARAVEAAGAEACIQVIRNLTPEDIARSVERFAAQIDASQVIFIPGGFSGGDEPDGSAKFITAFFRNDAVREAVTRLLEERDGLMCGICNGFQALIKLGLVPTGRITETDEHSPTLTFNTIGRHQSRIVRTRVASNRSPWLQLTQVGEIYSVPVSHGEGRFLADEATLSALAASGQIATQYVDLEGRPSMDIRFNPNGSLWAVEGITSPDGRVIGKMGHSERVAPGLYRNVPGVYDIRMFESAVKYFRK